MKCMHNVEGGCFYCSKVSDQIWQSMRENDMMEEVQLQLHQAEDDANEAKAAAMKMSCLATLQNQFDVDLGNSMINVGRGHDPYNHVGRDTVLACIGVNLTRLPITIGRPIFAAYVGNLDLPHGADKERVDLGPDVISGAGHGPD